jgi:hypothetical protein
MVELSWWQQLLLAVVFVAHLAVLADLVRKELQDWRLARRSRDRPATAMPVARASPNALVRGHL